MPTNKPINEMPEKVWAIKNLLGLLVLCLFQPPVVSTEYTRSDLVPAWKDLPDAPGLWVEVQEQGAFIWEVRLSLCANHLEIKNEDKWVKLDNQWENRWLKLFEGVRK